MKLTFKEACSAVATTFEAIPESWCKGAYYGRGVSHCAIGGLMDLGFWSSSADRLCKFAEQLGYESPVQANDKGGRLVAIKMLRMAAGEIE